MSKTTVYFRLYLAALLLCLHPSLMQSAHAEPRTVPQDEHSQNDSA